MLWHIVSTFHGTWCGLNLICIFFSEASLIYSLIQLFGELLDVSCCCIWTVPTCQFWLIFFYFLRSFSKTNIVWLQRAYCNENIMKAASSALVNKNTLDKCSLFAINIGLLSSQLASWGGQSRLTMRCTQMSAQSQSYFVKCHGCVAGGWSMIQRFFFVSQRKFAKCYIFKSYFFTHRLVSLLFFFFKQLVIDSLQSIFL